MVTMTTKMPPKSCCGFLFHHVFFLSIIFYAAIQFLFFVAITSDKKDVKYTTAYMLWSKNDTYFETCRRHYIGNYTRGKRLTNLVDKANAKPIVEAMNIKGLKIPKTYAIYSKENISDFTVENMRQIPQPFIIKPTRTSGGVSCVKNDLYTCIKRNFGVRDERQCELDANLPIGDTALNAFRNSSMKSLDIDYSKTYNELQYKDIPHQIIIEEDVLAADIRTDVSYWYTSNGRLIFVSIQCSPTDESGTGSHGERAYVNLNFEKLNLRLKKTTCSDGLMKPSNWDKQVEVATALAKGVPGILRIDLYAGDDNIFFSEFTYTTAACGRRIGFTPRVADGLLHALQYGVLDPSMATPKLVKSTIHDTSWVFLTLVNGRNLQPESSRTFPSPVDLCEHVNNDHIKYDSYDWQSDEKVTHRLQAAKEVATSQLRCAVRSNSDSSSTVNTFSDAKKPSFWAMVDHSDTEIAIALLFIISVMTWMDIGTKRQKNQYFNNMLFMFTMLIALRLSQPTAKATFSDHSILDITRQSFEAFAYVHPMESSLIALSHFATYWLIIAAWGAKSPRNMLVYRLLYETVTAIVNESVHLTEAQDIVHCTRVAFKESVTVYAFDRLIRAYVLPPFFVYGYLLPKFIAHWAKSTTCLVGLIAMALLGFRQYKLKVCKL